MLKLVIDLYCCIKKGWMRNRLMLNDNCIEEEWEKGEIEEVFPGGNLQCCEMIYILEL
jgi:hypothetical protein